MTRVSAYATFNLICVAKCLKNNSYFTGPTSSKTCAVCPILSNCINCQSATKCWICISGYYRNPTVGNCLFCAAAFLNCVECISSKCLKCKVGYAVNTIQCFKYSSVVTNCLTCQVKDRFTCYQCIAGYYLERYCPYSPNCTYVCLPCRDECLTCSNNYTCIKCKLGYVAEFGCGHHPACI